MNDFNATAAGSPARRVSGRVLGFAVLFVLLVAVAFRFVWLDTVPGLNGDEAWLGWKSYLAAHGVDLDWRTNSGNFTNPFFLLPLVWLHHVFEPSAWVLRVTAAISGVLTLLVNFGMCRWIFGTRVAVASTVLLAVVPMSIAYSRFGWEPSQIPLLAVVVVYSACALCDWNRSFVGWMMVAAAGLFAGFLVHPTIAYLAVLPVLGVIARWLRPEEGGWRAGEFFLAGAIVSAGLGVAMYLKAPPWIQPEIAERFTGGAWIADMPRFLVAWVRNFNGINTFGFLPGSWPGAAEVLNAGKPWPVFPLDVLAGLAFLVAMGCVALGAFRGDASQEMKAPGIRRMHAVLLVGAVSATLLFGAMNGAAKVAVWFDRYGLWALVPGCLILALGYAWVVRRLPGAEVLFTAICLLGCAGLLALFGSKYFLHFWQTSGDGGMDSRVGVQQIKATAAKRIADWSAEKAFPEPPVLISSNWFAFWPTVYFMQGKTTNQEWEMVYAGPESGEPLGGENRYSEKYQGRPIVIVEFEGSDAWDKWREIWPRKHWGTRSVRLNDMAGRPNLRIEFLESETTRP